LPLHGGADYTWCQVNQSNQKVVRVLRLDVEMGQRLCRKVFQIARHDDFGTGADGGSQDMAVVGIR
jgi:hypothetical protein